MFVMKLAFDFEKKVLVMLNSLAIHDDATITRRFSHYWHFCEEFTGHRLIPL